MHAPVMVFARLFSLVQEDHGPVQTPGSLFMKPVFLNTFIEAGIAPDAVPIINEDCIVGHLIHP
jgi:hypothetical protein